MILNVSGRTDVVAFYSEWFMNRYKEGFIDVRNPFNQKLVSRIYFEDVDLILFCTKNPMPIIKRLAEINNIFLAAVRQIFAEEKIWKRYYLFAKPMLDVVK